MPSRPRLALMMVCSLASLPVSAWSAGMNRPLASSSRASGDKVPDLDKTTKLLVEGTNAFRKEEHRAELKTNSRLAETAHEFAAFMASTDKYGHDADGSQPADRVKKHGYEYCKVAENIAYEFNSAGFTAEDLSRGFLEGWKKSPGTARTCSIPSSWRLAWQSPTASNPTSTMPSRSSAGPDPRPTRSRSSTSLARPSSTSLETIHSRSSHATREPTRSACPPLKFSWKESEGKPETFQPGRGDRFVITREQGKLMVKRRAPDKPKQDGDERAPQGF